MSRLIRVKIIFFFFLSLGLMAVFSFPSQAASSLDGRILLQVEDKGQAWYVNPLNSRRYYLGRPDDAFNLMRSLGLGVSNTDLAVFRFGSVPNRLLGRILLQVEDKGQAWYVNPVNQELYYLGRPQDAFDLMRSQALGITNLDLARIPTADGLAGALRAEFSFKYQNNPYTLSQDLSSVLYERYKNSPKVYTYPAGSPPPNPRESFYGLFLESLSDDQSISELALKLRQIAVQEAWSDDQLAEFTLALVQYIPYDHDKLRENNNRNINPYYPYETLYLNRGVCSDTTFLALKLLRELGYGAAILDFPDSNHSAVGIACPVADSLGGSGYCYVETTNYFPPGVIPSSVSDGQARLSSNLAISFEASSLGKMEIYQKSSGKIYQGLARIRQQAADLIALQEELTLLQAEIKIKEGEQRLKEEELSLLRDQLDAYYNQGNWAAYNALVPEYNRLVEEYNAVLLVYRNLLSDYNQKVLDFNRSVSEFYQK